VNYERQSIFKYAPVTQQESTVVSKDYSTPFVEESGLKHKKYLRMSRKLEYVLYTEPLPRVHYSVIKSCSVYVSIYKYSHENNYITVSNDI